MKRMIAGLGLAALLASPVAAKSWTVDPTQSKIGFHFTFSDNPVDGSFATWKAAIDFDPADLGHAHIKVTIDLASAATGDPSRDGALPTDTWFGVAANPQAVFEATTVKSTGPDAYEADGSLTLRGAAKPVALPFTLKIDGKTAKADGTVSINRTDWGVGQGDYAGDDPVSTKVDVTIALTATAAD